ncbi:MAG TPA: hypothetical protein VN695_21335 [Streptosporangiaceae bacterium]|nr:hypothetical protein [Streptosporangiaceae bacterium]
MSGAATIFPTVRRSSSSATPVTVEKIGMRQVTVDATIAPASLTAAAADAARVMLKVLLAADRDVTLPQAAAPAHLLR